MRSWTASIYVAISVLSLAGCIHREPDYAEQWAQEPIPSSPDAVRAECQRLRVAMADEQARQNTLMAMQTSPPMVAAIQKKRESGKLI
jgi:hypothetical protein